MAAESNFLLQSTVFLAAAVICVPIAKRLGLGSVLGYLIAGMLIGPFAIGFIGEEGEDIMHFAEFGVVIMLFLVGLELEPDKLWRLRKKILGVGMSQVIVTSLIVFTVGLALGLVWQSSLAVALALSLSSTAIVLQTLNEKDLMQSEGGQNSFSVLLFQDIAVIPILAILPLLAIRAVTAEDQTIIGDLPMGMQTLAVFLAVAIVILVGRFLVVPLLRIIARSRVRELFMATALLIVVSIAYLMQLVGLSAALGTFLAGVILANSEYRHELEADLEPVKGLLLGLFFIAVGASIDFKLIAENPVMIVSLTLALMAIKFAVLFGIGRFFRLTLSQNFLFAFALAQAGEFGFVIFSFVAQLGIAEPQTLSVGMAIVALSMTITPLLFIINEKLIQPRLCDGNDQNDQREMDVVEEHNKVIIAGFGHFGGTIGRFLRANGVEATYIDSDPDQVNLLRKLGFKVYYGDATRADFLLSAGAEHAKVFVSALAEPDDNFQVVETLEKFYPHLKIMMRARNRIDAYEFIDLGLEHIYREGLDTSVRLGVDVLTTLGRRAYSSKRAGATFLKRDEQAMWELAEHRHDRERYISEARVRISSLEEVMEREMKGEQKSVDHAWDSEPLVKDFGES